MDRNRSGAEGRAGIDRVVSYREFRAIYEGRGPEPKQEMERLEFLEDRVGEPSRRTQLGARARA